MSSHRRRFLDVAGPIAFAHRGGADEAPENTLPAFAAAVAMGYGYVETDVHLTGDGVVVAFHDASLDRVTDRHGRIADLSVAAVETADAGYWFTRDGVNYPHRGTGVTVPRLATLLEALPGVRINIDVKSDAVVTPLLDLLDAHAAHDRVCVGSFSDRRLDRVRAETGGRICTSMGPRGVAIARFASLAGVLPSRGADCLQLPLREGRIPVVDSAMVRAAHRAGLPVHVWTINDVPTMNRLLDLGVDGIMTDRPRTLRDVFARHGLALDGSGRVA